MATTLQERVKSYENLSYYFQDFKVVDLEEINKKADSKLYTTQQIDKGDTVVVEHPEIEDYFFEIIPDGWMTRVREIGIPDIKDYFNFRVKSIGKYDNEEGLGYLPSSYLKSCGTMETAVGCCGVLIIADNFPFLDTIGQERKIYDLIFKRYSTIQFYDRRDSLNELVKLLDKNFLKGIKIQKLPKNPKGTELVSIQLTKDQLK